MFRQISIKGIMTAVAVIAGFPAQADGRNSDRLTFLSFADPSYQSGICASFDRFGSLLKIHTGVRSSFIEPDDVIFVWSGLDLHRTREFLPAECVYVRTFLAVRFFPPDQTPELIAFERLQSRGDDFFGKELLYGQPLKATIYDYRVIHPGYGLGELPRMPDEFWVEEGDEYDNPYLDDKENAQRIKRETHSGGMHPAYKENCLFYPKFLDVGSHRYVILAYPLRGNPIRSWSFSDYHKRSSKTRSLPHLAYTSEKNMPEYMPSCIPWAWSDVRDMPIISPRKTVFTLDDSQKLLYFKRLALGVVLPTSPIEACLSGDVGWVGISILSFDFFERMRHSFVSEQAVIRSLDDAWSEYDPKVRYRSDDPNLDYSKIPELSAEQSFLVLSRIRTSILDALVKEGCLQ